MRQLEVDEPLFLNLLLIDQFCLVSIPNMNNVFPNILKGKLDFGMFALVNLRRFYGPIFA